MSLKSFQLALAEIISNPQTGKRYSENPNLMDSRYELTEKEKERLAAMAGQKGMRANYMLYQMNRMTPLSMFMGYTLKVLRPQLMAVLQQFWAQYPQTSFQFRDELAFFVAFLKQEMDADRLSIPYLRDIVAIDEAINDIRLPNEDTQEEANDEFYTLHPLARIVFLEHDPDMLVEAMVTFNPAVPIPDIPLATSHYALFFGEQLAFFPVEEPAAEALLERRPVEIVPEELVEIGLLV